MIKKYSLVFIAFLCFSLSGYGQEIFNVAGGGTFPVGWTDTNNITASNTSISDYYLVEPGNPGDIIETASYNLSANTSATFEVDIRSYGSGSHRNLLVEVSIDGGTTFTQSYTTPNTTTSYTTRTINIATVSANTVLRLSVNATSGRGIRLQDLILTGVGVGSTDTELNFASTAYTANEGDGTASICVDIINPSATPTTANVVLTSTSAPHVTYSTTGITFPANSSTQQCVTVNLADNTNCGDTTDYTFELQSVSGGSSASAGSDNETTLSVSDDDAINATVIDENFSSFGTFTQVSETGGTEEWVISGGYAEINGYGEGTQRDWLIYNNAINFNNLSNESLVIDYEERYSGDNVEVFYSTDFNGTFTSANTSSATWTSIGLLDELSSSSSWNDDTKTFDLTEISGSSVYIGFLYEGTENWRIDNVELTAIECSAPASPAITVTPNTLSGLDYIIGSGPSVEQSFIVEGVLLTTGIDVTAPTGFLISKTSGGTYTSSVNIPLLDANGSNTIYVILESGLGINTYSGNITMTNLTAGLATPPSVAVSGEVTAVPTGCVSIFSDDFSGTLSQWSSTGDWTVTGGELKHNLSSIESESYIYSDIGAQDLTIKNYEWSVCMRNGNWDPATGNNFAYFLTSSNLNLLFAPNGYAVGVNQGSSNDLLTLYSVSSGVYTPIVTSTFNWGNTDDVCIRVTRTAAGDWELLYDAGSGEVSGGTTNNTTHTTGRYTGQIFEYSSSRAGLLWVDDINICAETLVPSPEINLQGNATDIADGNTAISTTDDTDFGDVLVSNSEVHTFTIQNTGTADLDLTTITSSNSDFVVSAYTNPTTVIDGNSTTFVVTFTPTTTGTSTATIEIESNDANEATYNFNVEGNGTAIPSILLNSSNPAVAASNITDGTDDNVIYAFNLSVTNYEAELTAFNFTTTGSATNADITNFIVWHSSDATFNAGSDTPLQTITTSLGSGSHAVSGISQTIANGSTGYIFITTDIPCGATDGNTIRVNAITTANLTLTTGNKSGIAYASGTHTITEATPNNVTALATANCENGGADISWTTATGCSDDYIVVASTSPLTTSPSGNGSSYTANTTFGSGTTYDSGFVVYKGSGTNVSVSGLTNGTQYYYTVFTRNGESWSSGNEVDCTQLIGYCPSYADSATDDDTGIINVTFNTINETSSGDPAYTDFTSISTDVVPGQSYDLSVSVDVFGFQNYSKAWIDWNGDGIFNTSTEEYDLGDTYNPEVLVAYSPLNITVPLSASIGSVRMRVATQYFYNVPSDSGYLPETLAPCETLYEYGEVEDYTINVITPCTPTHTFTSMLPTSGPEDTEITVTGTGFTASTTANFEGVSATVDFIDATTLIIHVPTGATTSNISIAEMGCNVQTGTFTVIEDGGSCVSSSGGSFTDIIISEVYDSNGLNGWYMELYNPTGVPVDLGVGDYELERYGEYTDATPSLTIDLTGTIAPYSPFVMRLGDSSNPCNTTSFDLVDTGSGINETDKIILTKGGSNLDVVHTPNEKGYSIFRNPDASGPTTTFSAADWTTDSSEDCSNLGIGPEIIVSSPTISAITDASDCSVLDYGVTAAAGNSGTLTYQWYFNNGVNDVWTPVTSTLPSGYTILGEDGDNLLMEGDTNSLNDLANYQFYCEVTEAGSCKNVSNAIQPNYNVVTWNGSWSSTPGTNSTVVLNANYDTASGGDQISFSACSLIINNVLLSIGDGDFVEVTNDLTVNGTNGAIEIEPQGSFVQINDSGVVAATIPTNLKVSKLTAPSNNWYEYTYWSSPVFQETPANGLALSNPNRRYQYNAEYYRDSTFETANDGTATVGAGVDDIDDNGNDWGNISTTYLTPGVGYASTHNPTVFSSTPGCPGPTCRIRYTFSGLFNNGVITVPLYRNDEELGDNNWNFVGNPYPSAISADVFLATNMGLIDEEILEPNPIIGGAIYLWSQNTAPSNTANGNNGLNFSDTDYAIINGTGQTAAQENGGDSTIPNRFIPSGQGFFISMDNNATSTTVSPSPVPTEDIQTANLIFNNAMRVTGDNNQFFRPSNDTNSINKLWLNLTSDNGVFSQVLVGYLDHATDAYDGMYFDAPKNGVTSSHSAIYTLIPGSDKKLAIQGKNSNSLTLDEVIPLGFYTSIDVATLYTFTISQFEGAFMTDNAVYINDKLLNTFHNLKTSDYTFTSETGEFNDRFEIVFTPTILLSIDDNLINSNEVTLTELQNGDVEIKVGHTHTIKHVDIIDITGRRVYSLQGDDSTEVYNLSKLSQAPYVAKITLSNGQVISKKAIKQK